METKIICARNVDDIEMNYELKYIIDHCDYLSKRMRMFPKGHPEREKWETEFLKADKKLERIMRKNGMQ